MRHNLNIRVSDKPQNGGVVACRTLSIREKLFTLLLGPKQRVMVVVPGSSVESIAITEIPMGGGVHEYAARYNGFVERFEKTKAQLEQLRTTKGAREAQAEAIGAFMFEVQELDALTDFDDKLWLTVIDTVTVHADGRMTFKFQGGTEIDA